jgi:hypothetical protein
MKRRMVDAGLWANEKFAELPAMARLLQIGLINLADDQGRRKAHPSYLRSQLFAYDDVSLGDMTKWLEMIMTNGTIVIYEADGKDYLQLVNWWDYQSLQYAQPSELPCPPEWQDRIRYNAKGNMTLTFNWRTVGGDLLTDTCDQHGIPLPIVATLPPRNPGGRPAKNPPENPGGNPPENVIKDQDQLEDQLELKEEEAPPAAVAAVVNPDAARVWAKWNANMPGVKTPVIVDSVNSLLDDYSAAEIEEAITIACARNIRSLSYVQGILGKGVFKERPKPGGGDYPPPSRTSNRGRNAAADYMQRKGMLNGRA